MTTMSTCKRRQRNRRNINDEELDMKKNEHLISMDTYKTRMLRRSIVCAQQVQPARLQTLQNTSFDEVILRQVFESALVVPQHIRLLPPTGHAL
jgi:hypothetical protein